MKPQSKKALEFLKRFAPQGPWALTSIQLDKKAIATQTFGPDTEEACLAWLAQYNGKRNIYFHVNPVLRPINKKAEREDIGSVDWLHVDIDPRPGQELKAERERALKKLRKPDGGVPEPTVIIFSGGGYQGFWKLEKPIQINGDLAKAEDAKRYNMQLEIMFGADNCHNIDRIMRLPGTINIPDEKKRKKGRTEELATVVEFNDNVYGLEKFTAAPILQSEEGTGRAVKVKISGNVDRVNLEDLPETVNDRLKMVIVQGHDPDTPKKGDNSRSAWLFDVVCNLIRAGVSDDQIFAIVTDPDYGIAQSVLEKNRPEAYAIRQIERGHEDTVHPILRQLNDKHCVISDIGGKCRVISEVFDHAMGRPRISRQTFDDFRNRYMHMKVEVGRDEKGVPIYVAAGKWWLLHEMRRQFDTVVFVPGKTIEGAYNLWKGYACNALPGNCDKLLGHIKAVVCQDNQELYDYMLGWMALAVQKPDRPGEVAVVMRGKMGTGKGFLAKAFGSLWGRHFMQITDPKHLVGNFNSHLRDVVVLFADEAFYAGDAKHASILKGLITEETITIEAKGIDAETSLNYIHLMMASNSDWVVPAGLDERRFFVLDVSDSHKQDVGYFAELWSELDNGGREAFLHFLMNYDISTFNVRKVPQTAALQEQKQLSMSLEHQWWHSILEEGRLLDSHADWEPKVPKRRLQDEYVAFAQRLGQFRRASPSSLGRFFKKVCPEGYPKPYQAIDEVSYSGRYGEEIRKKVRAYFYEFPPLAQLRAHFDKHCGGPYEWLQSDDKQIPLPGKDPF